MGKLVTKWWIYVIIAALAFIAILLYFSNRQTQHNEIVKEDKIKIVSLMPSLTQNIYYLNASDKLVGCTNYCQVEPQDSIEVVSSAIKPNIEKIVSLKPTIVLVSSLIPDKDIETLNRFGIKVEQFASPKTFDEVCSEFMRLAILVGREDEGDKIVEEASGKMRELVGNGADTSEALKASNASTASNVSDASKNSSTTNVNSIKNNGRKPLKIFMQIGASPTFAVLPNTFMNDYITLCGGVNVAADLTGGTVGDEFIVSKDPDVIFVLTMGITAEAEVNRWKQFTQMSATVNKKIFILDSNIACQPGPITFVQTLELMKKQIEE